jgi:hypothetical protein
VLRNKIVVVLTALAGIVVVVAPVVSQPRTIRRAEVTHWGGFKVEVPNTGGQSIHIPAGQLIHGLQVKGQYIEWQGANFGSLQPICDPSIRFSFGNDAVHYDSKIKRGCHMVGQWGYSIGFKVPRGSSCAELFSEQWKVPIAKRCMYVYE